MSFLPENIITAQGLELSSCSYSFDIIVPDMSEVEFLGTIFGQAVSEVFSQKETTNPPLPLSGIVSMWGDYETSGLQKFFYGLGRAAGPWPWHDMGLDAIFPYDDMIWARKLERLDYPSLFRLYRTDYGPYESDGTETEGFDKPLGGWLPRADAIGLCSGLDYMLNPTKPYAYDAGINILFKRAEATPQINDPTAAPKTHAPETNIRNIALNVRSMFDAMYPDPMIPQPNRPVTITFYAGPQKGLEAILNLFKNSL